MVVFLEAGVALIETCVKIHLTEPTGSLCDLASVHLASFILSLPPPHSAIFNPLRFPGLSRHIALAQAGPSI